MLINSVLCDGQNYLEPATQSPLCSEEEEDNYPGFTTRARLAMHVYWARQVERLVGNAYRQEGIGASNAAAVMLWTMMSNRGRQED